LLLVALRDQDLGDQIGEDHGGLRARARCHAPAAGTAGRGGARTMKKHAAPMRPQMMTAGARGCVSGQARRARGAVQRQHLR
jgi:hypothetical protein